MRITPTVRTAAAADTTIGTAIAAAAAAAVRRTAEATVMKSLIATAAENVFPKCAKTNTVPSAGIVFPAAKTNTAYIAESAAEISVTAVMYAKTASVQTAPFARTAASA